LADLGHALSRRAETGDRGGLAEAGQRVRDAAAATQDALREAQSKVDDRDPVASAVLFARRAADALAADAPNRRGAIANQRRSLEAFRKAELDLLRRAKGARLSYVPNYSPLYAPPLPNAWSDAAADPTRPSTDRLLQTLPGLREWGRLRERLGESLDAPVRESEPAGYSDALKTYFEVLGKEDVKK
jgi:hypothetical protein